MNEQQKIEEAYETGRKNGLKDGHSNPSPETKQFMINIQMEINHIKEKLGEMPTKDEMLLANEKLVNDIFDKAEKKFASKLTEKIVYAMLGAILLYVLGKVLNLL